MRLGLTAFDDRAPGVACGRTCGRTMVDSMADLREKVGRLIDTWLVGCILDGDIARMLAMPFGGNYAVGTLLFAVIDFAGGLLNGNVQSGHTNNMVAFLRRYLAPIDARYGEIPDLLVDMFRHPLVHESGSRRYRVAAAGYLLSSGLVWRMGGGPITERPPQCHLVKTIYRGDDHLVVNDHTLFVDIRTAIDRYRTDVLSGQHPDLAAAFEKAYGQLAEAVDVDAMAKDTDKRKKKLASKLKAQIETVKAWPVSPDKCFAD